MQRAYISKLLELAQQDDRICLLLADSGTNFDEHFRRNYPGRIFDFGISEQNAVGAAAGMALAGKMPFVFLQGAFLAYRAFEFVRNDVCFQNLNVKMVGQGSGFSISSLGPSHHTTEDIAVLRTLPNLRLYCPATPVQAGACTQEMARMAGPCYLRLGMSDEKEFFDKNYRLPEQGQDIVKKDGDTVIFSTGSILEEVVAAAALLHEQGVETAVVNVVRLKPFDDTCLLDWAGRAKRIFVVEEHQIAGGLGGIISERAAQYGLGVPVTRIGLKDTFARGYSPDQKRLRKENGLDAAGIAERIRHALL